MIQPSGFSYHKFNFPTGEMQVNLNSYSFGKTADMNFIFEKNEDIIELLLVCDALKNVDNKLGVLGLDYVPFGRQDRANQYGECFSLRVFADLINSLGFESVVIKDPHSDVTTALIKNSFVIPQEDIFRHLFSGKKNFHLVSPDGGSLKKIYKLAKLIDCLDVIECSKQRNTKTGEITGVKIPAQHLHYQDCYIVDDIADGGKTFVEIAKVLKKQCCGKVILMVTHGFFTKGLEVFDGLIDEIYTLKGRVK